MDPEADVPIGESAAGVRPTAALVTCVCVCVTILSIPLCPQGHDGVVTLCRYPFVFDAQAKTTLLQTDAVIQMQVTFHSVLPSDHFGREQDNSLLLSIGLYFILLLLADGSGPSADAKL